MRALWLENKKSRHPSPRLSPADQHRSSPRRQRVLVLDAAAAPPPKIRRGRKYPPKWRGRAGCVSARAAQTSQARGPLCAKKSQVDLLCLPLRRAKQPRGPLLASTRGHRAQVPHRNNASSQVTQCPSWRLFVSEHNVHNSRLAHRLLAPRKSTAYAVRNSGAK